MSAHNTVKIINQTHKDRTPKFTLNQRYQKGDHFQSKFFCLTLLLVLLAVILLLGACDGARKSVRLHSEATVMFHRSAQFLPTSTQPFAAVGGGVDELLRGARDAGVWN